MIIVAENGNETKKNGLVSNFLKRNDLKKTHTRNESSCSSYQNETKRVMNVT